MGLCEKCEYNKTCTWFHHKYPLVCKPVQHKLYEISVFLEDAAECARRGNDAPIKMSKMILKEVLDGDV